MLNTIIKIFSSGWLDSACHQMASGKVAPSVSTKIGDTRLALSHNQFIQLDQEEEKNNDVRDA